MRYPIALAFVGTLILLALIRGPNAEINTQPAVSETTKGPVQLSEQDKAAVIKAALEARSHQATPKEFKPAIGASVPNTLFLHGFEPAVTGEMPVLKDYWYAYLDAEILLIDSLRQKVVAVIPLPAELVNGDRVHQGAAEPATRPNEEGAPSTGSVPSYTSPESIR